MNLSEFLAKASPIKPAAKGSTKQSLRNNTTYSSVQTATSVSSYSQKPSPVPALPSSPESLLPLLKKKINSVQLASSFLKDLLVSTNKKSADILHRSRYAHKRTSLFFKIADSPAEFTFRSRPNNLKISPLKIQLTRKRKHSPKFLYYEEPTEDISSITEIFHEKGIDLKLNPTRYSITEVSNSTGLTSEKPRQRGVTLYNENLLKPILSDSSSSSSEESIEFLYIPRQDFYTRPSIYANPYSSKETEPVTNKDYKVKASKPLAFTSPEEISNGEAVKFGYLLKRIRDKNTFHKRWVVLRGFKIFWYRKHTSTIAKRVVHLGKSLVYFTEAGKEKCLAVASKERVVQFKHDQSAAEWGSVLNSQICFKGYLDEYKQTNPDLLEYFQDLNCSQIHLKSIEIRDNLFIYFINALPAHCKLQSLTLSACSLTDNDVIQLCDLIKANCGIQSLDLSENFFTSRCVLNICSLLKQEEPKFNTIMNLNLSDNAISDEAVEALSRAFSVRLEQLFLPKLMHQLPFYDLKLNRIDMGDIGLNAINSVLHKANYLLQTEELEARMHLELCGNYFSNRSFKKFAEVIAQYQGIKELNISHNINIEDEEIILLIESLSSNFSIDFLDISGLNLTRTAFSKIFPLIAQSYALKTIKVTATNEFKIAVVDQGKSIKNVFELE